eukprot:s5458_g4.t1
MTPTWNGKCWIDAKTPPDVDGLHEDELVDERPAKGEKWTRGVAEKVWNQKNRCQDGTCNPRNPSVGNMNPNLTGKCWIDAKTPPGVDGLHEDELVDEMPAKGEKWACWIDAKTPPGVDGLHEDELVDEMPAKGEKWAGGIAEKVSWVWNQNNRCQDGNCNARKPSVGNMNPTWNGKCWIDAKTPPSVDGLHEDELVDEMPSKGEKWTGGVAA